MERFPRAWCLAGRNLIAILHSLNRFIYHPTCSTFGKAEGLVRQDGDFSLSRFLPFGNELRTPGEIIFGSAGEAIEYHDGCTFLNLQTALRPVVLLLCLSILYVNEVDMAYGPIASLPVIYRRGVRYSRCPSLWLLPLSLFDLIAIPLSLLLHLIPLSLSLLCLPIWTVLHHLYMYMVAFLALRILCVVALVCFCFCSLVFFPF